MRKWFLAIVAFCVIAGVAYWLLRSPPGTPGERSDEGDNPVPVAPAQTGSVAPVVAAPGRGSIPPPSSVPSLPETSPATSAVTIRSVNSPTHAAVPPVPVPTAEASSPFPPAVMIENMRTTVRQYGLMFGGNPVGTNPEITKALNGDNPKQVKFLGPDGNRINEKGELVDPWGTPYFFHQLSGMEMEIHSAGPDKTMWTADDLVVK